MTFLEILVYFILFAFGFMGGWRLYDIISDLSKKKKSK